MKALTITQPWATLIATGHKRIETRSWATKYQGPLAIHAGAGPGSHTRPFLRQLCREEPFRSCLFGADWDELPKGQILACATLTGCVDVVQWGYGYRWNLPSSHRYEREFGFYGPGQQGWLLNDVVLLPDLDTLKISGAQGLWNLRIEVARERGSDDR